MVALFLADPPHAHCLFHPFSVHIDCIVTQVTVGAVFKLVPIVTAVKVGK